MVDVVCGADPLPPGYRTRWVFMVVFAAALSVCGCRSQPAEEAVDTSEQGLESYLRVVTDPEVNQLTVLLKIERGIEELRKSEPKTAAELTKHYRKAAIAPTTDEMKPAIDAMLEILKKNRKESGGAQ